jgi:hypothetical protein
VEASGQGPWKKPVVFPRPPVYVTQSTGPLMLEWVSIVDAYEKAPDSLRAAWLYLGHHPAFWTISERVGGFHVVSGGGWYQSIETGVNDDDSIWVEIQPSRWPDDPGETSTHLVELEAGNYELAVKAAAAAVHASYGNDREFLVRHLSGRWQG